MPNKYQVDRDTKKPDANETDKQRLERLNRRVSWNLELNEDDIKFFEDKTRTTYKKPIIEKKVEYHPTSENKFDKYGVNEAILRTSEHYQKLGDGKRKKSLLMEAQIKDGRLTELTRNYFKEYNSRVIDSKKKANPNETAEERKARLRELAKMKVKYLNSLPNQSGGGSSNSGSPETFYGKRGGRYTNDVTKDGRPYRRYF